MGGGDNEFTNELRAFRGGNLPRVPIMNQRPLDIRSLYEQVILLGGYHQVVKQKAWSKVW